METIMEDIKKFQFPSNGKAYPKFSVDICRLGGDCFCFNSLQTGKHIQSKFLTGILKSEVGVSIPFKRESISKGAT